jgi:hypothetical protein
LTVILVSNLTVILVSNLTVILVSNLTVILVSNLTVILVSNCPRPVLAAEHLPRHPQGQRFVFCRKHRREIGGKNYDALKYEFWEGFCF